MEAVWGAPNVLVERLRAVAAAHYELRAKVVAQGFSRLPTLAALPEVL